jgi:hypothetical protein
MRSFALFALSAGIHSYTFLVNSSNATKSLNSEEHFVCNSLAIIVIVILLIEIIDIVLLIQLTDQPYVFELFIILLFIHIKIMLWDIIGEDNSFAGVLSKPNVSWQELLDHESIITEFKNQNKQLLE